MVEAQVPRLTLKPHEDRRVRAGHPWIFSNEIDHLPEEAKDGGLVDVHDARGAFLGIAYLNRRSLIAARLLTRGRDDIDVDFFVRRFERAKRLRDGMAAPGPGPRRDARREVYGEGDLLPGLVVDRYGDWLAVQILTLGMQARADDVRAALERVYAPAGAVRIADSPLRTLEGLPLERTTWWGDAPQAIEVEVEGFQVEADLLGGQKTGLYLDQRVNRRHAEARAQGRRVLDLFCYQGEWMMHALRGGAREVVAVDSSAKALATAARQLERNGFAGRADLRRDDAFDASRSLEESGERFGMVILDPPALIKSRRTIAAGTRAYRELNRAAMTLLEEEGVLITCSCSHHMDDAMFQQVLVEAARAAKRPFRMLEVTFEPPDHPRLLAVPETHYLKCVVLQAL